MIEVTRDNVENRDSMANNVREFLSNVSIDRFVIEAVLDSYIFEVTKTDVVLADDLMTRMEEDDKFLDLSHNAIFDALAFSTFVGTLKDPAYLCALDELRFIGDSDLEEMRVKIFEFGVGVACHSAGGSPSSAKIFQRIQLFRDRVLNLMHENGFEI